MRAFVHFCDDNEPAAGLYDSKNLAHIGRQVGPPEVRFHRGDQIEHLVAKRELGYRRMLDLDASHVDPARIGSLAGSDTLLGIIHAIDLALGSDRGELVDGPTAATTYIENAVVLFDGNVRQTPVCHARVPRIHAPQNESAQPSGWLLALRNPSAAHDYRLHLQTV